MQLCEQCLLSLAKELRLEEQAAIVYILASQKEAAEIKHQEGPIDVSNVMYYDAKTKAPTRIGYKVENGKKVRVSKQPGAVID